MVVFLIIKSAYTPLVYENIIMLSFLHGDIVINGCGYVGGIHVCMLGEIKFSSQLCKIKLSVYLLNEHISGLHEPRRQQS